MDAGTCGLKVAVADYFHAYAVENDFDGAFSVTGDPVGTDEYGVERDGAGVEAGRDFAVAGSAALSLRYTVSVNW